MTEAAQQCLVLIKPDGLVKSLTGDVLSKLAETKLKIVAAKIVNVSRELAERHYNKLKEEKGEKIFEETLKYIMGHYHTSRVFALVYEGEDAIQKIRVLAGATNPEKADPTTIRGKFGRINSTTGVFENVMHASENGKEAEREIKLWFKPEELVSVIYPNEKKKDTIEYSYWK
jgi:nucleoside-diphosphate kinase